MRDSLASYMWPGYQKAFGVKDHGPILQGQNLEIVGDHNRRIVLRGIRQAGAAFRKDLARDLGVTYQTVINITKSLLRDNLIMPVGSSSKMRGQPATKFAIRPDGAFAIGLSVAGHRLTMIGIDFLGTVRTQAGWDISGVAPDDVLTLLRRECDAILASGKIEASKLAGVGLALPHDFPALYGRSCGGPWADVPIAAVLEEIFKVPVALENNVAAATIGELHYGRGLFDRSFLNIVLTAQCGSGFVLNGQYLRAAKDHYTQISSLPFPQSGELSLPEGVETVGGLFDIDRIVTYLRENGRDISHEEALDRLFEDHDPLLMDWLRRAADQLYYPLFVIGCGVHCGTILLGGDLPAWFVNHLCADLDVRFADARVASHRPPKVQPAMLPTHSCAMGAAIVAFQENYLPK